MKRMCREVALVLTFFAAVLALFFYPAVFGNKLIYSGDCSGSDLLELNIPRRVLAAQAVRTGEMPLWEPNLGNGLPLLAEGQAGTFYPTTLPLYLTCSPTTATNYSLLTTLLVALLGGYALSRSYGASPAAALFGGLAYGLGGAFIFRLKHLNMVQVIAWLPLSLALIRMYAQRERWHCLLGLAFIWAFQFLAGHPHVTYICWLTCYLYALALYISGDCGERCWKNGAKFLLKLLFCTFLALTLSAVQLAPTWELVQSSNRSEAKTWQTLQMYPFKASHLLRLLAPYSSGNPADGSYNLPIEREGVFWESTPYLGLIPLALALWALVKVRRPAVYALALLALIFLWSALGPQGWLFAIFWKLCPFFALFRFPARLLIPFLCLSAVLASLGAQNLYELGLQRWGRAKAHTFLGILVALTLIDLAWVNGQYQAYLPADWEKAPTSCQALGEQRQRVYAPTYFLSWSDVAKRGWLDSTEPIMGHLRVLNPDLAAIWGVRCHSDRIVFEGGVELAPYFDLQVWEYAQVFQGMGRDGQLALSEELLSWLRLQGVSHLTSFVPIRDAFNSPQIAAIEEHRDERDPERVLRIYTLATPSPLVRLVPLRSVTGELSEPARFVASKFPGHELGKLYERDIANPDSIGEVKIVTQGRNSLVVETSCSESSYMIVANNFAKNWKAVLEDGRTVAIERVNGAYQALELPAGDHRVTLSYCSPGFSWGWKISVLALLALLGGAAVLQFKHS